MKKIINVIIVVFISLSFLTGCKMQDNITPKPEDYIEWDGNYFYYANYRCKTDMTEEEEYLSSVIVDDIEYEISGIKHYKFYENKVHMIAYIFDDSISNENIKYILKEIYLIYSFETEQVEYIYNPNLNNNDEIELSKILYISNEYTIFVGSGGIIKLEYNLNEIKVEVCNTYEVKEGYIVIGKDNKLFTATCDDFEFREIEYYDTKQNKTFDYYIQKIDGRVLLQIIESSEIIVDDDTVWVNSLTYYDFENNKFFKVIKFSDKKRISMDRYNKKTDIFIVGEEKSVDYSTNGTLNPHIIKKTYIDNNILCTVTINENVVELTPLYTFPVGYEYSISEFEGNVIKLGKTTLSKPKDLDYYLNITSSITYFSLDSFEFLDDEDHPYDKIIYIVQNENFVYYFKAKKLFSLYLPRYAYYLYQYDPIANEENLLAFYEGSSLDTKFKSYIYSYEKDQRNCELEILVRNS